jgi:hypothetical protein
LASISQQFVGIVTTHKLTAVANAPDTLYDSGGLAHRRLGVAPGRAAAYLIRPDGHVGYRSGGSELGGLHGYLRRWLPTTRSEPAT